MSESFNASPPAPSVGVGTTTSEERPGGLRWRRLRAIAAGVTIGSFAILIGVVSVVTLAFSSPYMVEALSCPGFGDRLRAADLLHAVDGHRPTDRWRVGVKTTDQRSHPGGDMVLPRVIEGCHRPCPNVPGRRKVPTVHLSVGPGEAARTAEW